MLCFLRSADELESKSTRVRACSFEFVILVAHMPRLASELISETYEDVIFCRTHLGNPASYLATHRASVCATCGFHPASKTRGNAWRLSCCTFAVMLFSGRRSIRHHIVPRRLIIPDPFHADAGYDTYCDTRATSPDRSWRNVAGL